MTKLKRDGENRLFLALWEITLKKVRIEAISAVILERSEGSRGGKKRGFCGRSKPLPYDYYMNFNYLQSFLDSLKETVKTVSFLLLFFYTKALAFIESR